MESKKLFRFHALGCSLSDSLDTVIEVSGLSDLKEKINEALPFGISRIHIQNEVMYDDRLPEEWNGISYYVIGDLDGYYAGQVVGMSNFYEE